MSRPYVVTVSSEKGGVGKTTVATNLAIYLKAVAEDLPVTILSFDNHFTVDRMFRIGRGTPRGDVSGLLQGIPLQQLTEVGEYGVQFVSSSRRLGELRERLAAPDLLARLLVASRLEGVLIIDTRPDLDPFTRNALYAADRVIVPVKDAPSLENCRNLYDFFDRHGLSRRPLRLLPCLIDSRIRYSGPFSDSYRLLKGYSINRGYRCYDGYISKSPKVESLGTNPEGKIYPVLTHGRGTEVHQQFAGLARQVLHDLQQEPERRLEQIGLELDWQQTRRGESFQLQRRRLAPGCLACGATLVSEDSIGPAGYYAFTSDGRVSGYLEEECFTSLVFRHFYQSQREPTAGDPLRDLFRDSAQRSYFALRRDPRAGNFPPQQIVFHRFDEDGLEVSRRTVELQEFEGRFLGRETTPLYRLATRTLLGPDGRLADAFLLLRRVSSDFPEEILYEEPQSRLSAIAARIADQLPFGPVARQAFG
jgi:cellulose biosynthesis protein BcsQ